MLESLLVQNFQRHESYRLDFSPYVTCIVGDNDVGKSSLLRALRWVCFNRPAGSNFIRHGEDKARAKLWVDGHTILRAKGGLNLYQLDKQKFKAFGNDVPEQISRLLNVSDANFQRQLDLHYWFSDTAGQVSRSLNEIINLDQIDTSLAYVSSELRRARSELEFSQTRLKQAQRQKQELAWALEADKELSRIEKLKVRIDGKSSRIASLRGLVEEGERDRGRLARLADAHQGALVVRSRGRELKRAGIARRQLSELVQSLRKLQRLERIEVPDISPLRKARIQLEQIQVKKSRLAKLIRTISLLQSRCPTCGQSIP